MIPTGRPRHWVGRAAELAVARRAVADLRDGRGTVVWVEGEPGIGKSALVATALADCDPSWNTGWGMADQLAGRLPLRVMLDCLQVRPGSSDPRRSHAAELLRKRELSLPTDRDASGTGVEGLATLVDELCAAAPTVLVLDDAQWADEASLILWNQLAAWIDQLPLLQRVVTGDVEASEATARRALAVAEEAGDASAAAHALADLWLTLGVRRDHAAGLGYLDRALSVLGDNPVHQDMHLYILTVRIFSLQNLDRWTEAEQGLRLAREFASRTGIPDQSTWANAAVLRYWLGQWDDALAELGDDADVGGHGYLRERWPLLLIHGVTALIAGHREQRATAEAALEAGLALPIENLTDRECQDFLVAAHALALEQRGETGPAMKRLATMLTRGEGEMTLIHQWLPDLVRLALAAGDPTMARRAAQACQAEAAAETFPARAAAASLRCQGLLGSDPSPLTEAVAHYRAVGPAVELPAVLEDLAVVLAARGRAADARQALNEAIALYEGMQASWDIRRAESRVRSHGVGRGRRPSRRGARASYGWAALTPTEGRVAALVARGASTSDIAQEMFLSRRTVQTYISRILTKLDARSRVEIVREAARQGVPLESRPRMSSPI